MRHFALTLSLVVLAAPALGQTADAPISTATNAEEGEYLVDGSGLSLYLFKADTQGGNGRDAVVTCFDDCLLSWPPLLVSEMPVGSGNVRSELLGTVTLPDGSIQATYNGWPLYYYIDDYAAGDINGHDIESFGEDWYLLSPAGERAREDDRDDRDDRDDDDGDRGDDDGDRDDNRDDRDNSGRG
ncbi:MAG TPA: hypothetical protein VFE52_04750 [Devosia sp.]|nr:hypothetical protein [Devosia sp.]